MDSCIYVYGRNFIARGKLGCISGKKSQGELRVSSSMSIGSNAGALMQHGQSLVSLKRTKMMNLVNLGT